MDAIYKRRSVRKFISKKVEDEKIDKLLRAAMQAPSAGNQQPWEFIVVKNRDTLEKLAMMSPYSKMVADSSVAFVLLANKEAMRYEENWQQDMGAATQNLLLQATELDLGAVWLGVAPLEDRMNYVSNLFKLPKHILPYAVVPVGYSNDENKFIDRYNKQKVHYEKYQKKA